MLERQMIVSKILIIWFTVSCELLKKKNCDEYPQVEEEVILDYFTTTHVLRMGTDRLASFLFTCT